jgi:hypothetical protein
MNDKLQSLWHRATIAIAFGVPLISQAAPELECRSTARETIFGECPPAAATTATDDKPVTVGIRFAPKVPGEIRGVRFFLTGSTIPATGYPVAIWSAEGVRLGSGKATAGQNPASGWLTGPLDRHLRVEPNRTYVATYFAPGGHYSVVADGLSRERETPYLRGLSRGGVRTSGSSEAFPAEAAGGASFNVDVIFVPDKP